MFKSLFPRIRFSMKTISYWASTHTKAAISLIVLIEVVKNSVGSHLGRYFFPILPGIVIELLVIGLVVGILLIETQYNRQIAVPSLTKTKRYQLRTRSTFCLFLGSFLLFILFGNRLQHFTNPQTGDFAVWANGRRVERPIQEIDNRNTIDDVQRSRPLTRKERRQERRLARHKYPQRPTETSKGVYFLLFVLGIGLAYLGAGLACSLSCSNQGVAAVLVGLLALGALVGGIYFLVKALSRKPAKSTVPRN